MVTATPTNVVDVLRQLLDQAISSASQQPQHLSDFFKQVESDAQKVVDEVKQIPEDVVQTLKEPPFKPPDWWSLLVFLVVHIRDLLDNPRLTVGYRHPAGWSRMLTLNLLSDDPGKVPAATIIASVGVAITDPDVTHGVWLQTVQTFDANLGGGALQVDISATGNANWQYVIGAEMTKPGQVAHANVDVRWSPYTPDVNFGSGAFTFNLGPLHLGVRLSSAAGDPLYTL